MNTTARTGNGVHPPLIPNINIEKTYDPLTEGSLRNPNSPWVGINRAVPNAPEYSLELSRLERLMKAYIDREISGCSVLIGGDRGAGKTSLVLKVVERLRLNSPYDDQSSGRIIDLLAKRRPLLVRVHGPKLFDLSLTDRPPSRNALRLIAEGLHRALIDEFSDCLASLADTEIRQEMAAQFRMELDEGPNPTRLREIWTLFSSDGRSLEPTLNRASGQARHENAQYATAELVALSSSIQVCKEIRQHRFDEDSLPREGDGKSTQHGSDASGTSDAKPKVGAQGSPDEIVFWKLFSKLMVDGGKLIHPLTGFFVGALVFAALVKSIENFPIALFVALISALATTILLNFAAARNRLNPILTDSTLATLDRTLPTLFRRVEAAGLFPIVVIDELDKVLDTNVKTSDELYDRMSTLIRDLKYFVADQAFTCFLTGRTYYEHVLFECKGEASRRKNVDTFFTDKILVSHQPSILLEYLDELFMLQGPPSAHLPFLKCLYLYNARGHLSDLHDFISRDHKLDHSVFITPGQDLLDHPIYRDQVLYQLAVHLSIENKETLDILRESPDMLQPLNRVLYAPSRIWESHESDSFTLNEILEPSHLNKWKKLTPAEVDVLKGPLDQMIGFLMRPDSIFDSAYWPPPATHNAKILINTLTALKTEFTGKGRIDPLVERSQLLRHDRFFFRRSAMFNQAASRSPIDNKSTIRIRSKEEWHQVRKTLQSLDSVIRSITKCTDGLIGLFCFRKLFSYSTPATLSLRDVLSLDEAEGDLAFEMAEMARALSDIELLKSFLSIFILRRIKGEVIRKLQDAESWFSTQDIDLSLNNKQQLKNQIAALSGRLEASPEIRDSCTLEMLSTLEKMRMIGNDLVEWSRLALFLLRRLPN